MAESKLVLGYWGIRGAAQPIRNLLAYLNLTYEDKHYNDRDEWFNKDKPKFKGDFPNLPYLIDGDKQISESQAILVYLSLKANREDLLGTTNEDKVHIAQINGVFEDLKKDFLAIVINKALPDLRKEYDQKIVPRMTLLYKHLGENEFLIGKLTILDFIIGEFLSSVAIQDGDWFASFPNFKKYIERLNSLPGIKEYNASGKAPQMFMIPGFLNENWKLQLK